VRDEITKKLKYLEKEFDENNLIVLFEETKFTIIGSDFEITQIG